MSDRKGGVLPSSVVLSSSMVRVTVDNLPLRMLVRLAKEVYGSLPEDSSLADRLVLDATIRHCEQAINEAETAFDKREARKARR